MNDLPSVEKPKTDKPPKNTKKQKPKVGSIELELPVAITGDFIPRRVRTDVRHITDKQRKGLNYLMEGMKCKGLKLASGQEVNNHVNTIRMILEMAADASEI